MTRPLTEADRAAFRDRMCDVAQAKFAQHGFHAVTMRDLAAGIGVSSMTPYRYFEDKDEIINAVRTRAFTRLADAMDAAEATLRESDWIQPGEAYFGWAMANRDAYRLMFIQPPGADYPERGRRCIARARRWPRAGAGCRGRACSAAMSRTRPTCAGRQRTACWCSNCQVCCGRRCRHAQLRCELSRQSRRG